MDIMLACYPCRPTDTECFGSGFASDPRTICNPDPVGKFITQNNEFSLFVFKDKRQSSSFLEEPRFGSAIRSAFWIRISIKRMRTKTLLVPWVPVLVQAVLAVAVRAIYDRPPAAPVLPPCFSADQLQNPQLSPSSGCTCRGSKNSVNFIFPQN
jgi:hypothetical protein